MTDQNEETERQKVRAFLNRFYENYYTLRDYRAVGDMVTDDILSVGLGPDEVGYDRESFERFVKRQMEGVPTPIRYFIKDDIMNRCGDHWWSCYALVGLRVSSGDWGMVRYLIRLMTTVRRVGEEWKFVSVHVSEASGSRQEPEELSFGTRMDQEEKPRTITQREVGYVMNKLVPGGVISRLSADRYPIAIANDQFLKMSGYGDFASYAKAQGGLFVNSLHPDDVEKYIYTARFIANTGKQYESQYRIRRKDGSYLWVYDVGRRAISAEGRELIVSVLTDMSDQMEYRQKLENENGVDFLTKVYNRKGAKDCIKKQSSQYDHCMFLVLDLDNFKLVNDLYGHMVGDEILQYIAGLLWEAFGHEGVVCRMGGDEFSVVIPDYVSLDVVREEIRRIAGAYRQRVEEICPDSDSALSIGGVYGTSGDSLRIKYQKADANLYRVKNHDKGKMLITSFDE